MKSTETNRFTFSADDRRLPTVEYGLNKLIGILAKKEGGEELPVILRQKPTDKAPLLSGFMLQFDAATLERNPDYQLSIFALASGDAGIWDLRHKSLLSKDEVRDFQPLLTSMLFEQQRRKQLSTAAVTMNDLTRPTGSRDIVDLSGTTLRAPNNPLIKPFKSDS